MPTSVVVQPNGDVEILMNFGVMVSLDGITFQAADSSGGPGWRNGNLSGSWGSEPAELVQYWQDKRDIVYFRRPLERDPIRPGPVALLGIGYRPTHRQIHKAVTSDKQDGFARVDVLPNGSVELVSGIDNDNTRLSLTGIAFHTQEPSVWRGVECRNNLI